MKSVKCVSDPGKCLTAAAASCPAPGTYTVVTSDSHAGGALADVLPGPVTWYAMTYVCGASDGGVPQFPFRGPQAVPVPITPPQPRTGSAHTTCTRMGDTVNCTTY